MLFHSQNFLFQAAIEFAVGAISTTRNTYLRIKTGKSTLLIFLAVVTKPCHH